MKKTILAGTMFTGILLALFILLTGCASRGGSVASPMFAAEVAPKTGALPAGAAAGAMYKDAQPSLAPPSPMGQPGIDMPPAPPKPEFNTEEYARIEDNPFRRVMDEPVSTFSVDVDTASYANLRRYILQQRQMPPKDAVRIEEMVNYFGYDYPEPTGKAPVAAGFAMAEAPWAPKHRLLRVAIKAKTIDTAALPPSNLVFLLDTSGSMMDEDKLPLLKDSLRILVERLRPVDKVSIVAYAGSAGLVLDSTPGSKPERIIAAFEKLEAGGSTAGGAGIRLAYDVAKRNFIQGGNNRVILCTDGDFNVGVSSTSELDRLVEDKRKENVYLTVIGVGTGNYKDSRMESLADKGNGNYAYIDSLLEGKKVLGKEIWGTLFAVAKDVKIQIEFNPTKVREYRLIGYENRILSREDFNDDRKDAGEMGSGHTVTAFYELVMEDGTGAAAPSVSGTPAPEPLVFQTPTVVPSADTLAFRLRYKVPGDGAETSTMIQDKLSEASLMKPLAESDADFRFASAVVEFGMLLRDSPFKADASWKAAMERARKAKGEDPEGYRAEFVRLVEAAELLAAKQ